MNTADSLFNLIEKEIKNNSSKLSQDEIELFHEYYREAGLVSISKKDFFYNHYAVNLEKTNDEISKRLSPGDVIVDLGGGCGSQAIYFASKGFKVLVIDMDKIALRICKKRVKYYEKEIGIKLNIETLYGNALEIDWGEIGSYSCVYSLFAFNMIQPSEILVQNITANISKTSALICIQDGNNQHPILKYLRPRKVKSKKELNAIFIKNGFFSYKNEPLIAMPPLIHWMLGKDLGHKIEQKIYGKFNTNISWLHTYFLK
jgi:16S rRNA G966 N2-methylase RsmD